MGRTVVPRVTFGRKWVERSALEIYREDIARFRPILGGNCDEHPMEVLERGGGPTLSALRLHNGTVWRWNRPCYGITDGRPHLRIENRILPSGPTVEDELANAALWLGLMRGAIGRDLDVTRRMEFEAAHGRRQLGRQRAILGRRRAPRRNATDRFTVVARLALRDGIRRAPGHRGPAGP